MYEYRSKAKTLSDATFEAQTAIHRAHIIMLAEQKIISRDEARAILAGLGAVNKAAQTNPSLFAYMVYERALMKEVGEVAGKMHIGRSRNDLVNAANRMYYREGINRIVGVMIRLREALVDQAKQNLDTVMPVYTHRKQAQPITLGHYLMAHAEALGRNIDRYEDLYRRVNLNPLGSAASAGTGFPLNRERTAELLGFDGLIVNTVEGVAAWDQIGELTTVNALFTSQLSRLASELQLWGTDEYGMLDFDGGYVGSSSIMPQKKNAVSLEYIRQASAEALGDVVTVMSSVNSVEYQHTMVREPLEPRSLDRVYVAADLMKGVVQTMTPQKARMRRAATDGFLAMTELADTLVRESGLTFRDADEVMAEVVQEAISRNIQGNQITRDMIRAAGQRVIGRNVEISGASLKDALDPQVNVDRRNGAGGPAASAVMAAIKEATQQIAEQKRRLAQREDKLKNKYSLLLKAEQDLALKK
ncbi:argininosuccinate lyase [Pollutimonas bauzanensis]|uniref:Argininosuccinate lyase n=1 Tax=Pollutimonas bauzanensis TaxID=658167 RepID=A0A1M5LWC4_9BURK|nr:argininosuccinate lyase [Pollutimonas bauzanensis]SHG69422.1 argininosuccinate lyase [Pollutimonas bauzanensis]